MDCGLIIWLSAELEDVQIAVLNERGVWSVCGDTISWLDVLDAKKDVLVCADVSGCKVDMLDKDTGSRFLLESLLPAGSSFVGKMKLELCTELHSSIFSSLRTPNDKNILNVDLQ